MKFREPIHALAGAVLGFCPATIDTKTADSAVAGVIDDGGQRRAVGHREGIELVRL